MPRLVGTEIARTRSRIAVASRRGGDPEALTEARRDFAAAKLAAYVERVVAEAPKLTNDQVSRIAALLNGGA